MYSTNNTQFANIDVKLRLPNNLTKRVKTPLSFANLLEQVNAPSQLTVYYNDADGEAVAIEDDNDLQLAYACAQQSNDGRIKFCVDMKDVEMVQEKDDGFVVPARRNKMAGMPRKMIKNMIQREIEATGKESLQGFMRRGGFGGRGRGGHHGHGRGGHGHGPHGHGPHGHGRRHGHGPHGHGPNGMGGGKGPRKWVVILRSFMKDKNVSVEALHKMATDNTQLDLDLDHLKRKMAKLDAIENDMRPAKGFGGCGGPLGGEPRQWKNLMKAFCLAHNLTAEDVKQRAEREGYHLRERFVENFTNKLNGGVGGIWRHKRAQCLTKTDEHVVDLTPGQTVFQEISCKNGTHWPWKQNCSFGMDDIKEGDQADGMPIDEIKIPIAFDVAEHQKFQLRVPFKVHDHFVADGRIRDVHLAFRGPHGNTFGERITFKVRVTAPAQQIDEMAIFQLALKLHNDLKLGTFDDCVAAARACQCEPQAAVAYLQARQ